MPSEMQLPIRTTTLSVEQHKVLRNTYWMLGLTMIPTIIGAMVGTNMSWAWMALHPVAGPLGMFAVMMGLLFAVTATRQSPISVVLLLAFTFVAGVFLGPLLSLALALRNGGQLIALAGGLTGAVFFSMAGIATFTKRDFSFLGNFLFVGLILLVAASVGNMFFHVAAFQLAISAVAVLIFSLYLLYDLSNIIHGGETNYVMATLNLYLNLYNIFVSLLNLLMAFSGQRD